MGNHPIEGLMDTAMGKIRQMVDVNTIVGEAITTPDGSVIIPISKISYGFGSGGSDIPPKAKSENTHELFGGGAGAGISITPVGFLTVSNGEVKMLQIEPFNNSIDRIIGLAPEILETIKDIFKKNKNCKKNTKCENENNEESATVE